MKQKILNLISSILQSLIIIALFIPNFVTYVFTENSTNVLYEFGLFADFSNAIKFYEIAGRNFITIFMTITSVLLILLTVVALAHLLFIILELLGVKIKSIDKIKKILSIIAILLSVLVLVCMLITTLSNIFETKSLLNGKVISKDITYGTGTCFAFVSLIGGIIGLIGAKSIKNKTRKKSKKSKK